MVESVSVNSLNLKANNYAKGRASIFDFKDYRDFLKTMGLPNGKYSHSSQTLKKWALRLGYRSPSSLTMILNGQRFPSREMLKAIVRDLDLSLEESEYFELLVDLEKAKAKDKSTEKIASRLSHLCGPRNIHQISLDEFRYVSEWYFAAIKQLIHLPNFKEDEIWIKQKLRNKVSHKQIKYAIQVMLDLLILKRDAFGKLEVIHKPWRTKTDIPSAALRKHHAGMLELASEAIEEQAVEERNIRSLTLRFDKKNMQEAKEYMGKVLEEFNQKFCSDDANENEEVYQFNTQFFSLSKGSYKDESLFVQ